MRAIGIDRDSDMNETLVFWLAFIITWLGGSFLVFLALKGRTQ